MLAAIAASGCRKIQNPMPSDLKRTGFLLNYSIKNPDVKERVVALPVAKHFENGQLTILTRGTFVPQGVLESYMKASGVKVEVSHYATYPEMHKRISGGEPFDIVTTAGFMVQILAQEGYLANLNYGNILNIKQVAPHFRSLPFDAENKYSVALVWHTVGIAYNSKLLDRTPRVWQDLFEPDPADLRHVAGRSAVIASPHRVFAAALMRLGFSPNSRDPGEMTAAADYLKRIAPERRFKLVTQDDIAEKLAKEEIVLAMAHSSDVTRAGKHNPSVSFALPHDGTWVSFDNVVVLHKTTAQQKVIAEDFINFLLHPTVAAEIANHSFEASTEPAAAPYLSPAIKFGPSAQHPREGWIALTADAATPIQDQTYEHLVAAQPAAPTKK